MNKKIVKKKKIIIIKKIPEVYSWPLWNGILLVGIWLEHQIGVVRCLYTRNLQQYATFNLQHNTTFNLQQNTTFNLQNTTFKKLGQ